MSAAPYGSALNPLVSVDEPCPGCGCVLDADLEPRTVAAVAFAELSLARETLERWRAICAVCCTSCDWFGSAFRPDQAIAA